MRPNKNCRQARQFAGDFLIGLAIFLAVLALAVFDTRSVHSAPAFVSHAEAVSRAHDPSPSNVTTGTLFLRNQDSQDEPVMLPAMRLDTNVDITVNGPIARATVTQRFRNTSNQWGEGVYAFPLPESAAVDTLEMRIGRRLIKGRIKPHDEVQQLYRAAKQAGRKTSPLAQHRPNTFTTSIANIGPGEEIAITIEYQETLRRDGDTYSLRFPLAVAPRYTPHRPLHPATFGVRSTTTGSTPVFDPASGKTNPVSLQVRLNSGFALGAVASDTHEIVLRRTGDETAVLALAPGHVSADRDFELTWRPEEAPTPEVTAFRETLGGNTYVLAMLAPPKLEAAPNPMPRDVIFVIDTSGSMAGTSLGQARESLALALKRLKPGDRFNVIRFDSSSEKLFDNAQPVTRENVAIATHFLSQLKARGGTQMLPALKAALHDPPGKDSGRARQVVFLTDGAVTNEADFLSHLAAQRGRARLFMIGIGSAPNSFLMRRAAEIGRGNFVHISGKGQVLSRMNRLFVKLERPVLTDLKVDWAPGVRADAWPDPLPDLYAGEPILITGQLSALKGDLKITGKLGGEPWSRKLTLASARTGTGIGKFWARNKIASLEARRYTGQPERDIAPAIETVALEHGLVSRMTSLVAVDMTPPRPEDQPLASEDLPVNLPAGWVYEEVFKTPRERRANEHGTDLRAAALVTNKVPGQRSQSTQEILPSPDSNQSISHEDTSGPSANGTKLALKSGVSATGSLAPSGKAGEQDQTWTLTVMALVFAFMTAVTLGLWRHLHHAVSQRRIGRRVN